MMVIFVLVLIAVSWIACGIVAAGLFNADLRYRFPDLDLLEDRRSDRAFSLRLGIFFGPFAIIVALIAARWWAAGWTLSARPIFSKKVA